MNKAFVREPDDTGQRHCPRCGSLGIAVQAPTLVSFLNEEARANLAETAFYCPFAKCEVAYFDDFERIAKVDALLKPAYPKDPEAPVCGCFGLTLEDIEQDVDEGGVSRVRALLAKSQSPEARCATMSPTGQCCMPEVQRIFMRLRTAAQGG